MKKLGALLLAGAVAGAAVLASCGARYYYSPYYRYPDTGSSGYSNSETEIPAGSQPQYGFYGFTDGGQRG